MPLLRSLPCLLLLAAGCRADKAVAGDSYENGVGTSFTVPLNPQAYTAQVSPNSPKYSVSGADLDRADLSVASSYPVGSYSAPAPAQQQAEERDGAGGHHHHAEHAAAPAPAQAAEPTYQQPVSTGNLYYYYYPVAAQPIVEKSDSDDLDPIVLVLLPVAALVGLLALLSIFNVTVTGRAFDSSSGFSQRQSDVFGSWQGLQERVDGLLGGYYQALESESCMDRVVCELGTQANSLSAKALLMTALDWFTPAQMQARINIFKEAATEGMLVRECKARYACEGASLAASRRK